ncbi:MAG: hypothetical protein MI919_25980, partial [Holophagales bacterium]|nr:hypothetical protein [Holophagales bacterium]
WSYDEARRAASAEHALVLLGRALERIPGRKMVLFLGYGLGSRLHPTSTPHFATAREALLRARAPLHALNVTDAASNTLEVGLARMAWKSGGSYHRTATWPGLALRRIEHLFHGHYLLFVPWIDLEPGEHPLDVRLRDGLKGRVRVAATAIEATAEKSR